jgi:MOSC domain-containing protein YiiM
MVASKTLTATVVQVLTTPQTGHFRTRPVATIEIGLQGIPGDRHYGFTRPAGARERWYKGGTEIRSGRQITMVSVEDLAEIARRMDLPRIDPAWIGANIVVSGVPKFTLLPWGTRFFFGEGAALVNEGDNAPCRFAGAEIARHFPDRAGLDMLFPRLAQSLRGIVASVERAGCVETGSTVKLKLPRQIIWDGES